MKDKMMGFLFFLPSSKTLSYNWNFGSILGLFFFLQLFSGILLSFYYNTDNSFDSVQYIMYDVNYGWIFRLLHFNGANFFFFFLYLHILKGLFMMSFRLLKVWCIGVTMILFFMIIGFMGYVLVFSQMSYWAAVVIISLLSVLPYFGNFLIYFIWGSYSVINLTVKFFFVLHFLLPWLVCFLVLIHLIILHKNGSTSILYCHGDYDKVLFFPYYWLKDLLGFMVFFFFLVYIFFFPFFLGESEMFVECDILKSPYHISPEWYFLFFYTILRSISNKFFGVFGMFMSICILYFLSFFWCFGNSKKSLFFLIYICMVLTWLGLNLPEYPFLVLGQWFSFFFFFFFFLWFFFLFFLVFFFM
uniref:Cytochrome b n=1 Tax=Wellcomia compar TaxID=2744580 RepID=A0A8F7CHW7_9BILA|nr:cytochrome b [Wellcomia compar]